MKESHKMAIKDKKESKTMDKKESVLNTSGPKSSRGK